MFCKHNWNTIKKYKTSVTTTTLFDNNMKEITKANMYIFVQECKKCHKIKSTR